MSDIIEIKEVPSEGSFLGNFFYFVIWIPLKYAIIFALVYSAFPLTKQIIRMSKSLYKKMKQLINRGKKLDKGNFMSKFISFILMMIYAVIVIVLFVTIMLVACMYSIIVYLIMMIINL
jgi:tetrahydromethanopterin S-methyltransferase subunit F